MKRLFGILSCMAVVSAVHAVETPLRIDAAQSRVDIEVKATVDSFVGRLERYDATVSVETETGVVTGARFTFHFKDVATGKPDRDEQMHRWQDTAHHADGVFVLTELRRLEGGGLEATGALRLHGVERAITFPVTVAREGGLYAIDGDAALDTRLFGLPVIKKLLLLKVDPVVHVRFHLQGRVAESTIGA